MEPMVLHIFQREVARQARFGLMAASDVAGSLEREDDERVWSALQALLVSAANVSKLLFPANLRDPNLLPRRGESLRVSLGVDDTSPLAAKQVRDFRNDLEHFDERLDEWAAKDERRIFIDDSIGPAHTQVVIQGDHDHRSFNRQYDPASGVFSFWGQHYELRPIVVELERVCTAATAKTSRPWWEQD